jgi:3-oxoadipate enol-lactonase
MPIAKLRGASIHYELDGPADAPVVVLSNSLGTTLSMWDRQVSALVTSFRVLRYDTRGHGESSTPAGSYTLHDLGSDVIELLDLLQIDRGHMCGISLGGMTALWLGIYRPDRVVRIVAANTAAKIGSEASWNERIQTILAQGMESIADATMERWFTAVFRARDPELVRHLRAALCATNVRGYASCCSALRDADLREEVASIAKSVLVIAGSHDVATLPSEGRYLERMIVGSHFQELNAAHLSNIEDAAGFTEFVSNYLVRT